MFIRRLALLAVAYGAFGVGLKAASAVTLDIRVNASANDAEQNGSNVNLTSGTLNLASQDWVGMRFTNVGVPSGAYIISAYVTFRAKNNDSGSTSVTVYGEAADNSAVFTNGNNNLSGRTRTNTSVAWNSITSWTAGNNYNSPELKTVVQEIVNRSGWVSGNSLSILVQKTSGQRRAEPYDNNTSLCPLLHVEYVVVTRPVATRLLLVVVNSSSLTAQETAKYNMLQAFGYTVTAISANASQATYDTLAAANDVAYINEDITSSDLNTKLKGKSLGIVSEEPALADDFAMAAGYSNPSTTQVSVTSNTHYITSAFPLGSLDITNSSQPLCSYSGTTAPEMSTLGTVSGGPGLFVLEMNGKAYDGARVAGRRVQLPWGGDGFNFNLLSPDGINLLSRALAWAGGVVAYWRLDETSGTTANDSSVNLKHGTLTNLTFGTSAVANSKVSGGLSFDGADDYVTATNSAPFQVTKALSISAWIKGDTWGSGSDADVILRKGEANPNNWQLAVENGYVALGLDGNDGSNVRGNTLLQTGQWYHVVGTWDGSSIRLYVNGVLDKTPTARVAPILIDTRPVYMGGRSGADLFDGLLDDVRMFNHALSQDEINTLKTQGVLKGVRVVRWREIR